MKRTLLFPLFSLLTACTVGHLVGENESQTGAIICAATTCMGTTVCYQQACVQPSGTCGGVGGLQCPTGQQCVDDPRDGCDPTTDTDCSGVCVTSTSTTTHCGGLAGTQCPTGQTCVDDPTDFCHFGTDPDCPGMCVQSTQPTTDAGTNGPQACGGHTVVPLPPCPQGYQCVDDPTTCPMAADCTGICQPDPNVPIVCGGFVQNPVTCPSGTICVDEPYGPGMAADAPGICIKHISCGGFPGLSCPSGMTCVDDPSDSCDPNNGGADCPGECVLDKMQAQCGGLAGLQCPSGLRCVDDPIDSCDPLKGGTDCNGICIP